MWSVPSSREADAMSSPPSGSGLGEHCKWYWRVESHSWNRRGLRKGTREGTPI